MSQDELRLETATREQLLAEIMALTSALYEALSLLNEVDADANNIQLDIARFKRRHHRAIVPWVGDT